MTDLNHRAHELTDKLLSGHINDTILTANILAAFESVQSETVRRTLDLAANAVFSKARLEPEIHAAAMLMGAARGIEALMETPAAPDPMVVALARLFAAWWESRWDDDRGLNDDVLQRGVEVGLLDDHREAEEQVGLSEAGAAAIALAEGGR